MGYVFMVCVFLLMLFVNLNLTMLFYLHMFQLNSYQTEPQLKWIKNKFVRDILFRNSWLLIPVVASLSNNFVVLVTGTLVSIVVICGVNRKRGVKKPLVYTGRVSRFMVTIGIMNLIIMFCSMSYLSLWQATVLIVVWTVLLPFTVIVANFINFPVERYIKNSFINEAKKILANMSKLVVVGITGSYGKTSTKYFLHKLLSEKYNVLMTPGNYNTTLGVVKTIREKMKATDEIFLCEMGARHVNDIKEICDIVHPKYGIISSIGPQHLETFHSIENVVKTKFELADAIPDDGKVFLNYDNEYIKRNKISKNIVTYAVETDNVNFKVTDIKVDAKGSEFDITCKDGTKQRFKTRLIGKHNVINIAGAISVAYELGISLEELVHPVKTLEAVPHRLELVKGKTATIIDDAYNSNPIGAKAALDVLNCFDGEKIVITPGMIELGKKQDECNKEFGRQMAKICDYIVLVGKEQTKYIKEGINEEKFDDSKVFVTNSFSEGMAKIAEIKSSREKFVLIENDLPDNY